MCTKVCRLFLLCLLFFITLPAGAAVVNATWNSATDLPVTAASYAATGNTVNFTLNFAPATGTNLTVVNNTGLSFISGAFDNIVQGQAVVLSYNGVNYNYVAHYYGGTGNDLVLVWAASRVFGWGSNNSGMIGDGTTTQRNVMVPVTASGVLAGRTIISLVQGVVHSLALCSDGTVVAWGSNFSGQLGNNSTTDSSLPVQVDTSSASALHGKSVVALAAGSSFSLALCSDGTVAAWGDNFYNQLGDTTSTQRNVPVAVNTASGSALYGKTVVNLTAGSHHSLALCSDGTLAAWGENYYGQLGNNSSGTYSSTPVTVNATSGTSALYGKTVTSLAAGDSHSLAVCSDGIVAAWGDNSYGQLGNNSGSSKVPVLVNTVSGTSALYGKSVVAVAAGYRYCLALSADGVVTAWGYNGLGQLGDGTTTKRTVPVAVNTASGVSALNSKTVTGIAVGGYNDSSSRALCADGSVAVWGDDNYGDLGNNSTTMSSVPVPINTSPLVTGEVFTSPLNGGSAAATLMLVTEPLPGVTTLPATSLTGSSAVLNGVVTAGNSTVSVSFDYGTTTAYGSSISATPATVSGSLPVAVSATPTGLLPLTTYHFRVNDGTYAGSDATFTTPNNDASLSSLTVSEGSLSPAFAGGTFAYTDTVATTTTAITFTANVSDSNATLKLNGVSISSGSGNLANLGYGDNVFHVVVTAQDGVVKRDYILNVVRTPPAAITASYASGNDVPLSTPRITASGIVLSFSLNYAPASGANLMVVNNTGLNFINGTFDNLAQGQAVALSYNGVTYHYVANYYGGTGNDLVLVWAANRLFAWGDNSYGAVGDNSLTNRSFPVPVSASGVLAGKTIIAAATGGYHALALCSDGTLAAWGNNSEGQLGDGTNVSRLTPVAVNAGAGSALFGKTVVAIAAGNGHSMALCADGTLAVWGGQLGNGTTAWSNVPVAVSTAAGSALAGRTVVAIGAGTNHSLAVCADGLVTAWGDNSYGQLGDNTKTSRSLPVAVSADSGVSALYGKTVVALAGGWLHSLALCSDGTVAGWGLNQDGELGASTAYQVGVPVAVSTASGTSALYGKTVVSIAASEEHCMALCSDGTLAAWGDDEEGQLGNNTTSLTQFAPQAVNTTSGISALYGKTAAAIAVGVNHSMALCSDGTLTAWGYNSAGQLGDGTKTQRNAPVLVSSTNLAPQEQWCMLARSSGPCNFSLAVAASPPAAVALTQGATTVGGTSATLNGTVVAAYSSMAVSFEYGTTPAYGTQVAGTPTPITGGTAIPVSAALSGLSPGTLYHYRVNGTTGAGTVSGSDLTFSTLNNNATLSSLGVSGGTLSPAFDPGTLSYTVSLPYGTNSATLTPALADLHAVVKMNGLPISSGTASPAFPLNEGSNTATFVVTAEDGTTTQTYTVTMIRAEGPSLSSMALDSGSLVPAFDGNTTRYAVNVSTDTTSIVLTPGLADASCTMTVNGAAVSTGSAAPPISLVYGDNPVSVVVTSQDGSTSKTYVLNVIRAIPSVFSVNFASPGFVPLSISGLTAAGTTLNLTLSIPPQAGTRFTVVNNTSTGFINGAFDNLAQGQLVELIYNGTSYHFIANYYGGSGNDLVLEWADTQGQAWGDGDNGQLGVTYYGSTGPQPLMTSGALAPQHVIRALAAGGAHSLALCGDGSIAAWGANTRGQLGSSTNYISSSYTPVGVISGGISALHGKNVVAIAAGSGHSLALCGDGTIAAWGDNSFGQLGTELFGYSPYLPLPVSTTSGVSALYGKYATSISAGSSHNLAICSDGTVVAWGGNDSGQLGNLSLTNATTPVAVNATQGASALYGRTVVAIAAGGSHSLALCSDGTLAAWGSNAYGQLGDNTTTARQVPVAVNTASGVSALFGKTVVAIAAGYYHSLALCSDGTVVAWGNNSFGQLGDNSGGRNPGGTNRSVPVLVSAVSGSALNGKTVSRIAAGAYHSVAQCSDQTLAVWGDDTHYQLGIQITGSPPGQFLYQKRPLALPTQYLMLGEFCMGLGSGPSSMHTLQLMGVPRPQVISGGVAAVGSTSAVLSGTVIISGGSIVTSFDYGPTTAYGSQIAGPVVTNSGIVFDVSITGLSPATTYHYRVNAGGYNGQDVTFTTLTPQQDWRQQYFGTTANSGARADTADYDNDGIPNLIEWACNLSPTARSVLPAAVATNGANFEYTYSRSTAAVNMGSTFTVEWSDTLAAGSWSSSGVVQTVLSDDGTTQQVKAVIPINAATAKFVHLSVTAPP
jgi:alpha-tubulin suppressor-like RCC1 family protein